MNSIYFRVVIFLLGYISSNITYAENCGLYDGVIRTPLNPRLSNNVRLELCSENSGGSNRSASRACIAHLCGRWMEGVSGENFVQSSGVDTLLVDIAWEQRARLDAVIEKLDGLTKELAANREAYNADIVKNRDLLNKQVLDAKTDMMKSIQNIPLDLVNNETAYKVLKAKLEKDLANAFQPKTDP